jgi:hypothetical protein
VPLVVHRVRVLFERRQGQAAVAVREGLLRVDLQRRAFVVGRTLEVTGPVFRSAAALVCSSAGRIELNRTRRVGDRSREVPVTLGVSDIEPRRGAVPAGEGALRPPLDRGGPVGDRCGVLAAVVARRPTNLESERVLRIERERARFVADREVVLPPVKVRGPRNKRSSVETAWIAMRSGPKRKPDRLDVMTSSLAFRARRIAGLA